MRVVVVGEPGMAQHGRIDNAPGRKHRFGRYDRLVIKGAFYRVVQKVGDTHLLEHVTEDGYGGPTFPKTDEEINELLRLKRLKIQPDFYSLTLQKLRTNNATQALRALPEEELRTIFWKTEWCQRFLRAQSDLNDPHRPRYVLGDMARFVDREKASMDRWYLDQYGERRPPGRHRTGQLRKEFDYPSASTLRLWLKKFAEAEYQASAFVSGYSRCGNRHQLEPTLKTIVDRAAMDYCSRLQPTMRDIYRKVELELHEINATRPANAPLYVSERTVRRAIYKISPFERDAGRLGKDRAERLYSVIGKGNTAILPLERVEMDDWEADLHILIENSNVWRKLSRKERALVPRTRCTVTVAIDCATRCVVGLNISPDAPSAATAKAALRSILFDKSSLAQLAETSSNWPMSGRPAIIATDAGSAFAHEFGTAAATLGVNRLTPEGDPRLRGTIESFFRTLKGLCSNFAGFAFGNIEQKADYQAEDLASLTYEQFFNAVVLHIVDCYHHQPHSGLEGQTPYAVWKRLAEDGLPPPPSDEQIVLAFGHRFTRCITAHGIEMYGRTFQSEELGLLHKLVKNQPVQLFIDPEDFSIARVTIPENLQGKIKNTFEGQPYLMVPCIDLHGERPTLVEVMEAHEAVKREIRKQEEAGKPIRLAAHRKLLNLSAETMRNAHLPSHTLTQRELDRIERGLTGNSRAALREPDFGPAGSGLRPDRPGEVIARSSQPKSTSRRNNTKPSAPAEHPHAPSKPFGGGINTFEDDE